MKKIGILGTGTIASALVQGFCTSDTAPDLHFFLSPRNAEKAASLATLYPEQVTVCHSNQEVLDQSEWVFLTVIPRLADEILSPLIFREDHRILTIMSDHAIEKVLDWTGPVAKIVRMVPLPFAAMHIGPIAITPYDEEVSDLFTPLGQVISVDTEEKLSVISALTAVMSSYYHLLYDVSLWGAKQGLPPEVSLDYTSAFFSALNQKACLRIPDPSGTAPDGDAILVHVRELAYEMTPGGLNEMALKHILGQDGCRIWCDALDAVMDRLRRK